MKKILTGIQSTNNLTLGNYLGVIKPLIEEAKSNNLILFIADLHSITTPFDPEKLRENRKNTALIYKSVGFDFDRDLIFFQSDVKEHLELSYFLLCHSNVGELQRMTQYKDKSTKLGANKTNNIPTGLLVYPVLMASDILLYDPDLVYVGKDQKQHIEITRDIAERFNKRYNVDFFKLPEHSFNKFGSKILDLQNPEIKMSKSSENPKGTIFLLEDLESARKKIMSAKTDSLDSVKYDEEKQPGISNLMTIYSNLTNKDMKEIEKEFTGKQYGEFKKAVADAVCNELKQIQDNFNKVCKDHATLEKQLERNAKKCSEYAGKKMQELYKILGFGKVL